MSDFGFEFDASTVDPQQSFQPLPAGQYVVCITEAGVKDTKAGTGKILTLRYDVQEGEFKGRVIWDRINIINTNPQTQEYGQRALSSICAAIGVQKVSDSGALLGSYMVVTVKIRQDPTYGASNEVKAYEQYADAAPAPKPAAKPAPRAVSGNAPAFLRKRAARDDEIPF